MRFEDSIEACGTEAWLGEPAKTLREKTYQAEAITQGVYPKAQRQKSLRPLGIPDDRAIG